MVRTRFAPSPTGYLHIGSARTALYAWLYARKMQGQFILRIEDTDLERSTPEAVQAILDGMAWLKLDYDEGPFYQTKRFDRYREIVQKLIDTGHAYRCYCSRERLDTLRTQQLANKNKPRYDGYCYRNKITQTGDYVVRFKNPETGTVTFNDLVHGVLAIANAELDDLIIARTDGTPTYNFTVVVDDWEMRITHVIRGDDHLNNTPRQINILSALGAPLPQYAHLPMILGSDGKKLSKRHGAVSVLQYRDDGILPEALLNYLARLGWSHGDQEIFSIAELIQYFDCTALNKSAAAFNQDKLLWLNQHYLKQIAPNELLPSLVWQCQQAHLDTTSGPLLTDVILAQRERVKTLKEMVARSRYFYEEPVYTEAMLQPVAATMHAVLRQVCEQLQSLILWEKEAIHQLLKQLTVQHQLTLGQLIQPIRIALTGGTVSPPIDVTIALLGKERTIARLNRMMA